MEIKKAVIICILLIGSIFIYSQQTENAHYYDADSNPLPQFEYIYDELVKYYKGSAPVRITVKYTDKNTSQFDYYNETVLINQSAVQTKFEGTIAHESSHLCLENLTNGASVKQPFRFFDEGFAKIFENIVLKNYDSYKKEALKLAGSRYVNNKVSFDKVQNWPAYFGTSSGNMDFDAYKVGASFDFYIIDTYGMDKLFEFFKNIGLTYDLNQTLLNVFNKEMKTIEEEWFGYLKKTLPPGKEKKESKNPKIIKMFPENNSKNVSIAIKEIYIEFNMPMSGSYSIFTNCSSGVCYKNAYWKTDKILAVKADLLPGYKYSIYLGTKDKHYFKSKKGLMMDPVLWSFETGK